MQEMRSEGERERRKQRKKSCHEPLPLHISSKKVKCEIWELNVQYGCSTVKNNCNGTYWQIMGSKKGLQHECISKIRHRFCGITADIVAIYFGRKIVLMILNIRSGG